MVPINEMEFDSVFIPRPVELGDRRLVVQAGTLIDGTGAQPARNVTVIVEDEDIVDIVDTNLYRKTPMDLVVDATNLVMMPGIIDCHVHVCSTGDPAGSGFRSFETTIPSAVLIGLKNAWTDLEHGITTLRDMSSIGYIDVAIRDAINDGMYPGPRMFVAGQGLTMYGGHMDPKRRPEVQLTDQTGLANTVDEVKAAARYQISRGVDLIKFNTSESRRNPDGSIWFAQEMDYEMLRAGVREANKVRIHTAAHCHGGQGATDTIKAGVTSVEHGHWLTDEHFELMNQHGTYFCPTMACNEVLYRRGLEGTGWPEERWDWLKRVVHDKVDTLQRAIRAGVKIVSGSDAGTNFNYHGQCIEELAFLVDRGMKPMDAIVAATRNAAQLLGKEDKLGTLRKDMWADFILVDGNPLSDMRVLVDKENIRLVVKGGVPVVDQLGCG